jgi:replication factor C subunit 3/5
MLTDIEMIDESSNKTTTVQEVNMKESSLPLIEKYRPKTLKEMVSHEEILNTINLFLEKKNIPHFLFHGPPGTGKTSCILAIARSMYGDSFKKNTLELNASDDRGINVVRERIKEFCNTLNISSKATVKLVILDEADMMTTAAQNALRRVIEKYTKNVRFCLICNQVSKIIPAIQSRCMRFRFSPLKKEQCAERIKGICALENIPIDQNTIEKIVEIGRGDMRKILNIVESTHMSYGTVNIDNVYTCTGLPSEFQINFIVKTVFENEQAVAFKIIQEYKMNNGFSTNDLVLEVLKYLRRKTNLNVNIKLGLYKKFQKMDYLNNLGGNEKIVLSNLVGAINEIKINS